MLAMGLIWSHFALSLPVCTATNLALGAFASRAKRELPTGAFALGALLGAFSPFIAPFLVFAGSKLFLGASPNLWGFLLVVFGPIVPQIVVLIMSIPLAESQFIRDYPWRE